MRSLFVKVDGKYKAIVFTEICYVEALKNYVRIHTAKKVFVVHITLKQIEGHLPTHQFCRIHKSYIIYLDNLTEFDYDSVTLGNIQLPLSSQYAPILKSKLNVVNNDKKLKLKVGITSSIILKN